MRPWKSLGRLALTAAVVVAVSALSGPWVAARLRERELARAAPLLDPDIRRHLVSDSDRKWFAYGREIGSDALRSAQGDLVPGLHTLSLREFERNRRPLEMARLRVACALREIHDFDSLERTLRRDLSLSTRADFEQHQWEKRFFEVLSDTAVSPDARLEQLDRIRDWFLAIGDTIRAAGMAPAGAPLEWERGRGDLYGARLRASIALARVAREPYLLCQMLGELGVLHRNAGSVDSMRACYDEAIDLAQRHNFLDQAARLHTFYASFYAQQGRLAVATERLARTVRLAESTGEVSQIRLVLEYTKFLASVGCWDLAERNLRRAPPLLRKLSAPGQVFQRQRYAFDMEFLLARCALEMGRMDEGIRRTEHLTKIVSSDAQRVALADLYEQWSLGLERANRTSEALAICARGLAHCDSGRVPGHVPKLLLRAARLEASRGRLVAAEALVESVDAFQKRFHGDWSEVARERDVTEARLLFMRDRKAAARHRIERVYRQFRAKWRDAEGGSIGNLDPVGASELREALHQIEQFTPVQGYLFEMEWRSLTRRLRPVPGGRGDSPWRLPGTRVRRSVGAHLVYRFTKDALLRWLVDETGVTLDTIPLSPERCLVEVRRALESLQSEPASTGSHLGRDSFARLSELSKLLLPESLPCSPDRPPRIDISPDGPLSALPFEALPVPATEEGLPLALTADIAYLRGLGVLRRSNSENVVIVSNPLITGDLARRYGGTELHESAAEARDVLRRWPKAVVLSGSAATKDSIRERWPRASIIYLAAHHVRDPSAPFLGFVPLAAPAGAPHDAYIFESADIRALDLSACRLAVLASCSSGAPYRSSVTPGPSLGDAFVDSGAESVIRSFWDVGDIETREFMRLFITHWRADQSDAVNLGNARREFMKTPGGAAPRVWAAWSVLTSSTP